ncbi:MAG TPA: hypothetical protein PK264_08170 [Hyphomicrobiaceae bacterium]|nr:hypothetical protein [Hyphomicrobiaceae bacterium]
MLLARSSEGLWSLFASAVALVAPFLSFIVLEYFALPINAFTFRQWEALIPENGLNARYAFFPNATLQQWEYGDVHRYATITLPRTTRWFTDQLGYRNRAAYSAVKTYCFVTLGDSNVIGASLDQSETLSEALERRARCPAYNGSSAHRLARFLNQPEFKANQPRFVVLQAIAGEFYSDQAYSRFDVSGQLIGVDPEPGIGYRAISAAIAVIAPDSPRASPWMLEEIVRRNAGWQFIRARLGMTDLPPPPATHRHNEARNIHDGRAAAASRAPRAVGQVRYPTASKEVAERNCPEVIKALTDANARAANCRLIAVVRAASVALKSFGSDLIVYLQPSTDELLATGIAVLEAEGHKIIHFPKTSKLPYGIDFDWYWASDDSHWHPRGVELAAELILAESEGRSAEALLPAVHERIEREMRALRRR